MRCVLVVISVESVRILIDIFMILTYHHHAIKQGEEHVQPDWHSQEGPCAELNNGPHPTHEGNFCFLPGTRGGDGVILSR